MPGQLEESPAALACTAAETVRALNHATFPRSSRLTYPGDVYDVLGSLKVMAERLPQLCAQLARFLTGELAAGRVQAVEGQRWAGQPGTAVAEAGLALGDSISAARTLTRALAEAQQAIVGLAHDDAGEAR